LELETMRFKMPSKKLRQKTTKFVISNKRRRRNQNLFLPLIFA